MYRNNGLLEILMLSLEQIAERTDRPLDVPSIVKAMDDREKDLMELKDRETDDQR